MNDRLQRILQAVYFLTLLAKCPRGHFRYMCSVVCYDYLNHQLELCGYKIEYAKWEN